MEQFLEFAEIYLADSPDIEMLCAVDEEGDNPIIYLNAAARHFLESGGVSCINVRDAKTMIGKPIYPLCGNPQHVRNIFSGLREKTIPEYTTQLQLGPWYLRSSCAGVWVNGALAAFRVTWRDESYIQVNDISRSLSREANLVPEAERQAQINFWVDERISCQLLIDGHFSVFAGRLVGWADGRRRLEVSVRHLPRDGILMDRPVFFVGVLDGCHVGFRTTIFSKADDLIKLWRPKLLYRKPLRKSLRIAISAENPLAVLLTRAGIPETAGQLVDISHEGAGMAVPLVPAHPYVPGEKLQVQFHLPNLPQVTIQAEVRHAEPIQPRESGGAVQEFVGLLFLDVPDKTEHELSAYIHQRELEDKKIPHRKTGAADASNPHDSVFTKFKHWLNT